MGDPRRPTPRSRPSRPPSYDDEDRDGAVPHAWVAAAADQSVSADENPQLAAHGPQGDANMVPDGADSTGLQMDGDELSAEEAAIIEGLVSSEPEDLGMTMTRGPKFPYTDDAEESEVNERREVTEKKAPVEPRKP
jgi:hypothetical protein